MFRVDEIVHLERIIHYIEQFGRPSSLVFYVRVRLGSHGPACRDVVRKILEVFIEPCRSALGRIGKQNRQKACTVHVFGDGYSGDIEERRREIMRVHMELSRRSLAATPDLIVWSETTYPLAVPAEFDSLYSPAEPLFSLSEFVAELGVPHLVGADEVVQDEKVHLYNSALLFDRHGRISDGD